MPTESLTYLPETRPVDVDDDETCGLRDLARSCNEYLASTKNAPQTATSNPRLPKKYVLKIFTKLQFKGKEQAWSLCDSHSAESLGQRAAGDLIYFKGDIIHILDTRGRWSLGINRGQFGVVPVDHLDHHNFVRALHDYSPVESGEIGLTKGDILPAIPSNIPQWLVAFRGNEEGHVPGNHVEPAQTPFSQCHIGELYQYTPLQKGQIRLLSIGTIERQRTRACNGDTTFVSLKTFQWAEAPAYTALSYCWGDANQLETVFCGDRALRVTSNLAIFLKWIVTTEATPEGEKHGEHAAPADRKYLWADAICIDQSNLEEKEFQIPFMRTIYQNAEAVRVHLGESEDVWGVLAGFAMMRQQLGEADSANPSRTDTGQEYMNMLDVGALAKLYMNPGFNRTWMIQEMVLGKDVTLWYGEAQFDLDDISDFVQFHSTRGPSLFDLTTAHLIRGIEEAFSRGVDNADNLSKVRYQWQRGTPLNFIEVLRRFRGAKATDLRDKVYSLLGLATDHYVRGFVVSYAESNSVTNVFLQTARLAITSPDSRDIQALLECTGSYDVISSFTRSLPSWVPDWSISPCNQLDSNFYNCSGKSILRLQLNKNVGSPPQPSITIQGAIIDCLSYACPVWLFTERQRPLPDISMVRGFQSASIAIHERLHLLANEFKQSGASYGNPKISWEEAVWQTLLCGRGSGPRRATAADERDYRVFRQKIGIDPNLPGEQDGDDFPFRSTMYDSMAGRRVGLTRKRYFGAFPNGADKGDVVVILLGLRTPFLLRQHDEQVDGTKRYRIIGPCYVHGIMDGELVRVETRDDIETVYVCDSQVQDFVIT